MPLASAGHGRFLTGPDAPPQGAVGVALEELVDGRFVRCTGAEGTRPHLVLAAALATPETIAALQRAARSPLTLAAVAPGSGADTDPQVLSPGCRTGAAKIDPRTIAVIARGAAIARRPLNDVPLNPWLRAQAARPGGVLEQPGPLEVGVDLVRLAGLPPVAIVAGPARPGAFVKRTVHMIAASEVIHHRRRAEPLVERDSVTRLPTRRGAFMLIAYRCVFDSSEHLALLPSGFDPASGPAGAYVHRQCLASEAFGSHGCECGRRLRHAMNRLARGGQGAIVYSPRSGPACPAAGEPTHAGCPVPEGDDRPAWLAAEVARSWRTSASSSRTL